MKKLVVFILLFTCYAVAAYSQEKQDSLTAKNKPKAVYQIGNIRVADWENKKTDSYGEYTEKNYKVEKIYKIGERWEPTNYYDINELLKLRAVLDKAISEEAVKVIEGKVEK